MEPRASAASCLTMAFSFWSSRIAPSVSTAPSFCNWPSTYATSCFRSALRPIQARQVSATLKGGKSTDQGKKKGLNNIDSYAKQCLFGRCQNRRLQIASVLVPALCIC
eukprot:9117442-Pyramimonas_sp.AAC.2